MGTVPFLLPVLVLVVIAATKPSPRAALALAVAAGVLVVPTAMMLADAGGIECPNGCSDEQSALSSLVFLALPLTALLLVGWAVIAAVRRSRGT